MHPDEAWSIGGLFFFGIWANVLWMTPSRPDSWTHAASFLSLVTAYFTWRSLRWYLLSMQLDDDYPISSSY